MKPAQRLTALVLTTLALGFVISSVWLPEHLRLAVAAFIIAIVACAVAGWGNPPNA